MAPKTANRKLHSFCTFQLCVISLSRCFTNTYEGLKHFLMYYNLNPMYYNLNPTQWYSRIFPHICRFVGSFTSFRNIQFTMQVVIFAKPIAAGGLLLTTTIFSNLSLFVKSGIFWMLLPNVIDFNNYLLNCKIRPSSPWWLSESVANIRKIFESSSFYGGKMMGWRLMRWRSFGGQG